MSGSTVQVQTDRSYESDRDLIATIENKMPALSTPTISKYDHADPAQPPTYGNDALGRRTSCVRTGAAFDGQNGASSDPHNDVWSYDARNELTGSARFTGTGAGSPGGGTASHAADRAYEYDPIGNRKHRVEGDSGTPANWLYYCANSLNQYTTTDDASTCPPQQVPADRGVLARRGRQSRRIRPDRDHLFERPGRLHLGRRKPARLCGAGVHAGEWRPEGRIQVRLHGPAGCEEGVHVSVRRLGTEHRALSTEHCYLWYNRLMIAELRPGASGGTRVPLVESGTVSSPVKGGTGVPPVTKRYVWELDLAGQNVGSVGVSPAGLNSLESASGRGRSGDPR